MTTTLFPVNGTFQAETLRQVLAAASGTAPAGRPLGAISGVRPGTPASTASATSSTWTIDTHVGRLDLETPAKAGPYFYVVSVAETGAVTPASAANQRVDSLYVQMSDPSEGDGSSSAVATIGYLAGAPGASGGARGAAGGPPNLPARSMELAQLVVPILGGGSPVVSWVAPYWNGDTDWIAVPLASGFVAIVGDNPMFRIRNGFVVWKGTVGPTGGGNLSTGNTTIVAAGGVPAVARPTKDVDSARAIRTSTGGTASIVVSSATGTIVINLAIAVTAVDIAGLSGYLAVGI